MLRAGSILLAVCEPGTARDPARETAWKDHGARGGGFAYALGVLGAAVYYVQTATSFWMGALGILKALLWPAFLVHALLRLVQA